MYWNGQMGAWWQVLMSLGFVLFWAAVITLIVLLARSLRANQLRGRQGWGGGPAQSQGWGGGPAQPQGWASAPQQPGWAPPPPVPPGQPEAMYAGGRAEDVLAERFARGEIDEAEYRARLDVLRQQRGGA
ncbi:SHOCT domain-containing protein [Sinomonas mesophila]|uniref:SHOCT domain-containing protein n=1 Tax=Sinomonas mesophila TaxID=1531955 RepID=UPI0009849CF6|nr:SHOCT domain-containing protein [Sinomonas mesophila]